MALHFAGSMRVTGDPSGRALSSALGRGRRRAFGRALSRRRGGRKRRDQEFHQEQLRGAVVARRWIYGRRWAPAWRAATIAWERSSTQSFARMMLT